MNVKHDTLNLAHHETDELINHLRVGTFLPETSRKWLLEKLLLLQEDRQFHGPNGPVLRLLKTQGKI